MVDRDLVVGESNGMLSRITPVILTFNEAPNVGRVLERLSWASRIVVVDSFSTDGTLEIVRRFPRAELHQRRFDSHANQWNFGLEQVNTEWVLTLDADYVLTDAIVCEIDALRSVNVDAYFAPFAYRVFGRRLRASLYPPRAILFRIGRCRYLQDGHTQTLEIDGARGSLSARVDHDDRKPLSQWLAAQDRYAALEARKLASWEGPLAMEYRLRKMIIPMPFVVLAYTLFVKGVVLEGWPGWYYALQRAMAEMVLSLRLLEARFVTGDAREWSAAREAGAPRGSVNP